jgi:hypothetical protein
MDLNTLNLIIGGFAIWMVLQIWSFISKRRSRRSTRRRASLQKTKNKPTQARAAMLDRNRQHFGSHQKMWKEEKTSFGLAGQTSTRVSSVPISPEDVRNNDESDEPEMGAIVYTPDNVSHLVKRDN